MLLSMAAISHGQAGPPASVSATAGTPVSGAAASVLAGHLFRQRGNGTANVAVNYDFVHNTFQDAPNLRVHGKPFSVAFWYRSTQSVGFGLLWESGEVLGGTGYVVGLNDGHISVGEGNNSAGCSFPETNTNSVTSDGQWHHAAVVADPTAHQTYVYKDGTLDGTLPYCDPADNTSDGSNQWYSIGRNNSQYDFAGDIDHFTAWVGAALTPAEVNAHMDGGMPQFASVGVWYEFENPNGQRVPDLGPNHYDGHVSPDATPLVGPGTAFQALVQDAGNNPVPDVAVTFTAPASGASGTFTGGLTTVTVTTDATGTATAPTFTANNVPGSYNVSATVIGVATPANFSVTNLLGPPASITPTAGTPQSATIATPFATALQATVVDAGSNPIPGVTVTFQAPASGASGSFAGGINTAITDASGIATAPSFTANSVAGSYTVTATVAGVATPASFSLTNLAGSPASIAATAGTPQDTVAGGNFPTALQATVLDASNNPVPNVSVTFTAPASGASGSFTGGSTTAVVITDGSGRATAPTFTANATLGAYTVSATTAGVPGSADFLLSNQTLGSPASIAATAGTPQSAAVTTAFAAQLQATVRDAGNNGAPNVTVTFTAPSSGASGTFASTGTNVATAVTDNSGVATAPVFTANGATGPYTVTASVSGVASPANFSLTNTVGLPASVSATAGTPVSGAAASVLAGHLFRQRGNGTANVAVNYDFVHNTFQDAPSLRVHGKPFSVAFWYRSTQSVGFGLLWESGEVLGGTGYVVGLNDGHISVGEGNNSAGCSFPETNTNSVTSDGQWHHAAVVADPTAHQTYVYKDGTLDGTLPYCDPADNTSDGSNQWYSIGRNNSQYDFAGDIDHFTAWVGAALTPAEVNAHMDGGMPQFASVGVWYEFENPNGQRVPDLGPNHYDGHVSPDATPLVGPGTAFQALVQDAGNNPVPDVAVTFTAPASGASGTFTGGLTTVTVTTDATGTATAPTFTANNVPGSYNVSATVIGVATPANFSVTNLLGPPASITPTAGTPQSATIATPFATALQATVVDAGSNPIPGVTVTFQAPASGASGSFAGGINTAITDASGIATAPSFTANSVAGSYTVTATVAGVATPASFSLTNLAGSPASIAATAGTPQDTVAGGNFPTALQATVLDASNNPVPNVSVTFTAPASGASGSFTGGSTTAVVITDGSGRATAPTFTANATLGAYTVSATTAGVPGSADFLLSNQTLGSPASIAATAGTPQSAAVTTAFAAQLQATVRDAGNNGAPNVTVTFTAPSSGASGTFASTGTNVATAVTDNSGVATAPVFTANGATGPYTVTASVSGVASPANFSLTNTVGLPASVSATAGTPVSGAAASVLAGHLFRQRGNGTANVAVNYDFVHNTFQDAPSLRVHGKPFSVAFWYRSTQSAQFSVLWDNGEVSGNTGYIVGLNSGHISVTENGGAGCPAWSDASAATNDGQWHHAAIVADRTANSTYIYRDGTLDTTLGYCDPVDNTSNGSNQWYGIGRNNSQFDFAGDIDHFTAWVGAALTPAEVNAHMDGGMPQFASVGVWYEFENPNGQRVPDLGPNHYDGHVSPDATPLVGPGTAFQALVQDAGNNPVPDVAVTFTAPASGASGTFTGGLTTVTVTTDATGTATAPTFTADNVPGSYNVSATVIGVATPANFSVTNQPSASGSGTASATAVSLTAGTAPSTYGQPVTFTATVTGSGATPAGSVSFFDGGTCLSPGPALAISVALNGSAQASLTTGGLTVPAGPHTILACYSGDATYAPSSGSAVHAVNPATVTPSITASDKVYDGTTAATIATRTLSGEMGTDDVTLTGGTATFADANVGTAKTVTATGLTLSGTTAGNYQLSSTSATATADITAAPITVTADAKSKLYGDTDPALTYQVTSGSLATGDSFTGALTRVADENAGTHAIQQGTLALTSNYNLTYVGANLTITARAITVTADAKGKLYGDTDPALTYQVTSGSLATGDSFTGALTRLAGENAGTYAIQQGTLALTSNYSLTYVGANLRIMVRLITVTADAQSKLYGDSDPALTCQVTSGSLATGDSFTGALTRVAGENVGTYAIQQGTLALTSNYILTYVGANLTIAVPVISRTGWSVVYVDSQETVGENGAAVNAIDGNSASKWVTQWYPSSAPLPHEIQINLGASYNLTAFQYLARQDGCANGWIKDYEFYVSTNGVNWGTPVASGTFNYGNLSTSCPGAGVPGVMEIAFAPTTGQYIRLRALSEIRENPWTAVAELNVLGTVDTSNPPPSLAQVTVNPSIVVGGTSTQGTVSLSGPAPLGGVVVNLSSSDPSATVPPSVTVLTGSTTANFTISTSAVGTATHPNISGSHNGSAQTTFTVNPGTAISQTGWSVVYVDSQETVGENGAAVNAIDGNPASKWVTQWSPTSTPLPHEIQINLGASYNLTAFQYLARQDGCANGWIKDYEFYVSNDGVNWGTPVASGTFNYGNLSTHCPGAGVPGVMEIAFAATTGQYIRLRALSEIQLNPWTAVAELRVLGTSSASNPPPSLAQVTVNPSIVVGGTSAQGRVSLSGPAPLGGVVVNLSSSDGSATVPASVTVPANSTSANFTISTSAVGTPTPLNISGSYNGSAQAAFTVNPGTVISQTGWSVVYVDSQETVGENGAAVNAIDGNPASKWVTQWSPTSALLPHEIQINLGASYNLTAFQYLARQDGCANGWIKDYEFYVSTDGVNWGTPVASGTFNYGNLSTGCPETAGVPGPLQIAFPATTGQYIRLRALSEIHGNPWTAVAELHVLGTADANAPPPSLAQVTVNPSIVVGGTSAQGTVNLSGPAPLGGVVVNLSSSDPSATVPASVTVPANSTGANFTISTSAVGTATALNISGAYNGGAQAAFTVNPGTVISPTGWSVVYVDSQETVGENGAAVNAIDGNPASKWVTQWSPTSAPLPHEIQINLGASYNLTAFQYLARQDGCANGWIKQYEFYVSTDGVNWGTPVASGNFDYGNLSTSCPGAGVPGVMEIAFAATTGQYIRLRALSEIQLNPWTAVAELNVLGTSSASNPPPSLAQVTVNPSIVVGGTSAQGRVSLSGPAPLGGAVVNLSSSDPSATVPASVTVPANSTGANFTISTSAVGTPTPLNISGSYNGGAQAAFTVNPGTVISPTGWSVVYVDSQETARENGAGVNAIDGNPASKWVTQWSPTSAPLPHEIQINLGASYNLTAFQYLARQDGCANGWIKQYEFYVSTDGVNWGTPVAGGNFDYGNLSTSCPGAGVPGVMEIAFAATTGQYIRLRALSEIQLNPWTAVAEINVLGQ